jgi:beta-glucosidase
MKPIKSNPEMVLKPEFLLGVAAAATQIEGGDLNHSWNDWYKKGHIHDGSDPARADEHYRLWRIDAALMRDLGIRTYRMGIEWARVEPEEGHFDQEAIKHYIAETDLLKSYGIRPLVTLHHFTNPMWFEEKGGFEDVSNVNSFLRFAELMVRAFGSRVSEYVTINEPNVYALLGYFAGEWPPGVRSYSRMMNVLSIMAGAHIKAYDMIHRVRRGAGFEDAPGNADNAEKTKVGFAHHARVFAPKNPKNPSHRLFASIDERLFQGSLAKAALTGKFDWPLKDPFSPQSPRNSRGRYADFIGLNYYTRSTVTGPGDGIAAGAPVNDLGWEIYPGGIVECARKLYDLLPVPVYVTENGTCDGDDSFRSRFIYDHLKQIAGSDLPFERYYHWCFCDNFEWLEGESSRFGLVHIDYATQRRTVKESGKFYSEIIKAGGVSKELFEQYAKPQIYKTEV